jgi:hypothetical protein
MQHVQKIYQGYLLNKYLKCSVWRLAVRLGGKGIIAKHTANSNNPKNKIFLKTRNSDLLYITAFQKNNFCHSHATE